MSTHERSREVEPTDVTENRSTRDDGGDGDRVATDGGNRREPIHPAKALLEDATGL